MLVCSYWRNLLVSTPAFWRAINTKRHAEWTKLCLERSGAASLDLHMRISGRCALDMLYPYVHRIRKLVFSAFLPESQMDSVLSSLLGAGMPLLENLDFCADLIGRHRHKNVDLVPYLTSQCFPRLQNLVLEQVVLPRDKLLYAQLRTLSLSRCFYHLSFDDFLNALAGCAQLEQLTLDNTLHCFSGVFSHREPVPHRRPISLPSLRRISLDERGVGLIPHFLAHLHIPVSVSLQVTSDLVPDGDPGSSLDPLGTLRTLLPPNRSQALPILSEATEIAMSLLDERWSIRAFKLSPNGIAPMGRRREYSKANFVLYLDEGLSWDRWVAQSLGDLTGCFGRSPLTRLEFHAGDHSSTTVTLWETVFRTFSLLEELDVGRGPRAELSKVFLGLHAASHADAPVACLKLKRVSADGLGTRATYEAMCECFQSRADRGAPLRVLNLRMLFEEGSGLTSKERNGFVKDLRQVVRHVHARDH